ncbi:hypothetical protein JCM3766R1_001817 [Sporobolomyces carnicolor]
MTTTTTTETCDMVDRLPILLFVFQVSCPSWSPRLDVRLATVTKLHDAMNVVRSTPWPRYAHDSIRTGVIVVEHLARVLTDQAFSDVVVTC